MRRSLATGIVANGALFVLYLQVDQIIAASSSLPPAGSSAVTALPALEVSEGFRVSEVFFNMCVMCLCVGSRRGHDSSVGGGGGGRNPA